MREVRRKKNKERIMKREEIDKREKKEKIRENKAQIRETGK